MDNQQEHAESPSVITYIVGAIIVLAVVGGAWYFRTMTSTSPNPLSPLVNTETSDQDPQDLPLLPTPTPGPITALACDYQYFNPKNGFAEYYLSAAGGDFASAKNVTCDFRALVGDTEVARASASSALVPAPERNGATFLCTTAALALSPNVKTTVEVTLTDDLKQTGTCTADFTYPAP